MPEHEKEKIRNERSKYAAKQKISELTSTEENQDDGASGNTENRNTQNNRQQAEPIDAGDQMSHRNRSIGKIRSGLRHTGPTTINATVRMAASAERQNLPSHANAELDSHADTVVTGSSCRIIKLTN
jgi:hypothetical protein